MEQLSMSTEKLIVLESGERKGVLVYCGNVLSATHINTSVSFPFLAIKKPSSQESRRGSDSNCDGADYLFIDFLSQIDRLYKCLDRQEEPGSRLITQLGQHRDRYSALTLLKTLPRLS